MQKLPLWSRLCGLSLCSALLATPAWAQDETGDSAFAISGGVAAMTDYVWRGVSQTGGDPAVQGEVFVQHDSGLFAGVWATNVDFTGAGDEDDGIDAEVDVYLGYSLALGETQTLDLQATRVIYPGANDGFDYDYSEFQAALHFGEYYNALVAYSPDIFGLGEGAFYYSAGAELPIADTGFGLNLQVGYYDLDDAAGDSYFDYLVAVTHPLGPLQFALQYTNTASYGDALAENLDDASDADDTVALVAGWAFGE
ncbi:MAG TPA: TorF family putative porin [Fontimonas sp.]